jgi:hypothetical protein
MASTLVSTLRPRSPLGAVCATLTVLSMGCSFSDSSVSISKSISSPLASSSRSSSPEDAYEGDVRDYTAAYLKSGGRADELRRELSALAEKHGISDWEQNKATFRGIGAGLAKAGARQVEVDAFKQNLATTDEQARWIQEAFDSAR